MKKKILIVHSGGEWMRGSEYQVLEMACALRLQGRQVSVACDQSVMADAAQRLGIDAYLFDPGEIMIDGPTLRLEFFRVAKANWTVLRIANRLKADLIYANTGRATQLSYFAARIGRIPIVSHIHCNYNLRYLWLYRTTRVDCTIYCSQSTMRFNEKKLASRRAEVVVNGIDFERMAPRPVNRASRERYGIKDSTIVLGQLAAVVSEKGVEILLRAVAQLRQEGMDIVVMFAGNGEIDRFRAVANELGSGEYAYFIGQVSDPAEWFSSIIDINVLASTNEPFGRTVVEAAACGVYSVATNVGGLNEAMLGGQLGELFDLNNVQSLVDKLMVVVQAGKWKKKSLSLRSLAREKFDIQGRATQFINIVDSL